MRQLATVLCIFFLSTAANELRAQSLNHTNWKFYVESLHDTLTMHIGTDTSFSTNSSGEMIVRSHFSIVGDTIKIRDIDGEYPCQDGEGVYKYVVNGDYLSFLLVADPCLNRSEALKDTKFRKTESK